MNNLIPDKQIPEIMDRLEMMHPEAACALDFGTHFQLLSAVMLSAQTTDVSVNKVTPFLFSKYPTAEAMAEADPLEVQEIIKNIGLSQRNLILSLQFFLIICPKSSSARP